MAWTKTSAGVPRPVEQPWGARPRLAGVTAAGTAVEVRPPVAVPVGGVGGVGGGMSSGALVESVTVGTATELFNARVIGRLALIASSAIAVEVGGLLLEELASYALRLAVKRLLARRARARDRGEDPDAVLPRKMWVTERDSRVRDAHKPMDGVVVGLEESFVVDGHVMQHPGDRSAPAGLWMNCRCVVIGVTGD